MRKQLFLKGLTIASSLVLLTAFILYRSGNLFPTGESPLQASPNGGTITSNKTDTTRNRKDSSKLSKSPVVNSTRVIDKWLSDTIKSPVSEKEEIPLKDKSKDDALKETERIRMFSSKSAPAFKSRDFGINIDSFYLKKDSLKKKKP